MSYPPSPETCFISPLTCSNNSSSISPSLIPFVVPTPASICPPDSSTARCNFLHVLLFVYPCCLTFHSPSPYTFSPVESTTMCIGSFLELRGNITSNPLMRLHKVI